MSTRRTNRTHPDQTAPRVPDKTPLVVADRKAKVHRTSAGIRPDVRPASALPDMEYMRKQIPIQDVAQALGLSVSGKAAHCWRADSHHHGDAHPSIWFTSKNRGRCQVCDSVAWSGIDLVMMVKGIGLVEAARWIADRFPVRNIAKGKHLAERQRWTPRFRVGTGDMLENFVRSGLLAELTGAEAKVLEVLNTFSIGERAVISYLGIMRYAGIGSPSTIRTAIKKFQKMHLLRVAVPSSGRSDFRACNEYQFTVDDPDFQKLANDVHQRHSEEINAQRRLRAQLRKRDAAPYQDNFCYSPTNLYHTRIALYLGKYCLQKL